jgi:hypothetical protein
MVKQKTQNYRKVLLTAYGSYLIHKGKALNPMDCEIVFSDEKNPSGEASKPFLTVMGIVKEILGKKSLLERLFKI